MKELNELAQLSAWRPTEGRQHRLLALAAAGTSRTDARACFKITENHFNVVYKNLKDNLSQGVLYSNYSDLNPYTRQEFAIRKQYETAMMLMQADKRAAGVPLARAALRKAEQYHLFQLALDLSRQIRRYYSSVELHLKFYEQYTEKQRRYQQELTCELEAEDVFFDYAFALKRGENASHLFARIDALDALPAQSWRFHYLRFLCQALRHQVGRDDDALLQTCTAALSFFSKYERLPYVVNYSFQLRALGILLAKGRFRHAEILINKSLSDPAKGRHNWQIIMLHKALLGFHSGKPAIAAAAWQQASKVPRKFRTPDMEDRWLVVRAYLELYEISIPGTFRLARFVNSLSSAARDEHYLNVIIVELLHHLKSGDYEKYYQKCEAAEGYIKRHLQSPGHARQVAFLRLLHCVVRSDYDLTKFQVNAKKYQLALQHSAPRISADVRESEVVPYELLTELLTRWLK